MIFYHQNHLWFRRSDVLMDQKTKGIVQHSGNIMVIYKKGEGENSYKIQIRNKENNTFSLTFETTMLLKIKKRHFMIKIICGLEE